MPNISDINESVSRALVSAGKNLVGEASSSPGQSSDSPQRGAAMIKQLALGGAALGGGAGLTVALLNYIKSMRDEAEAQDIDRLDDDTLYVPMHKAAAEAEVNPWLAPGLAVTGGLLSAGGAYALTQLLYGAMQRRRRQQMLDEAQREANDAVTMEAAKSAAADAKLSLADLLTAGPVAIPLLTALATGGVAYAALNKSFPTVKKPKSKYPKRIRLVTDTGELEDPSQSEDVSPDSIKRAALLSDDNIESSAHEMLVMMVDTMTKDATHALTSDILGYATRNGVGAAKDLLLSSSPMEALCRCTDSRDDSRPLSKMAAAAVLVRDPLVAPVLVKIAAAECLDCLSGTLSHVGDVERLDDFAGLGVLMYESQWRDNHIKVAAIAEPQMDSDLLQALLATLGGSSKEHGAPMVSSDDSALTSDVSGSMAEDAEGDQAKSDEDRGGTEATERDGDLVDGVMHGQS